MLSQIEALYINMYVYKYMYLGAPITVHFMYSLYYLYINCIASYVFSREVCADDRHIEIALERL